MYGSVRLIRGLSVHAKKNPRCGTYLTQVADE